MKKIAIGIMTLGAVFFGTQNLQAQESEVEEIAYTIEDESEAFESIEVMALPQIVKEALLTDYNGIVAQEAWVKSHEGTLIYKLSIEVEGETEKVYIDEDGNWLDKDEVGDED
ncbi:hypothetical protein [Christiangramia aquimixticola]|uniref:hypothetical protein n=1 Tax=Christiangramia aquimixticola TaxID=1697558 RepID=UPI003AA89B4D